MKPFKARKKEPFADVRLAAKPPADTTIERAKLTPEELAALQGKGRGKQTGVVQNRKQEGVDHGRD